MPSAIKIKSMTKAYGALMALGGIDLDIAEGDFFGLLGPNGAGKTTLIRILTTLLQPTSGTAEIMGTDVVRDGPLIRKIIGVVPQAMTSDLDLTGREGLDIYARFYGMGRKERTERIDELLSMVGLIDRADDLVATYSGGMRRRLEIARGLVHKPRVLILDEPTIGLDPQSRRVVWDLLEKFRAYDTLTILLTTHYMDEAESLCNHVAIIDYGKIVALDTVPGLKRQIPQKDVVELGISTVDMDRIVRWISEQPGITSCVVKGNDLVISADSGAEAIPMLINGLKNLGAAVSRVVLKQQTLEDVFIHFTGRPIREEEARKVSFILGAGVPSKWSR